MHSAEQNPVTALFSAIEEGNLKRVEDLVEQGVELDGMDGKGNTPLIRAINKGDVGLVRFLLKAGVDVNQLNGDRPPLPVSQDNRVNVIRALLQLADTDFGQEKRSPLYWAVNHWTLPGRLDLVRLLLEAGADINQLNVTWNRLRVLLGAAGQYAYSYEYAYLVNLLVLYGMPDGFVRENPEIHTWAELGECLRAAQRELESAGDVSEETRLRWGVLHAANPGLYLELARLSPKLHSQERACFGAYPDVHWWKKTKVPPVGFFAQAWDFMVSGSKSFLESFSQISPVVEPKIPAIRRAAMDYLKAQGHTFSSGAVLSQAINEVLRKNVHRVQDGSWELGELTFYWEKYKAEPNAHLGTEVQVWGLVAEKMGLNVCRGGRLSVVLEHVQEEIAQDSETVFCGLSIEWSSEPRHSGGVQLIAPGLKDCQYLTELARTVIFHKEVSWDALQTEIEALKALPEYPLREDLRYFFNDLLQIMWELDKEEFFGTLDSEQKIMLRALAQYAECPELQFPCLESKPEEIDTIRSFDLKTVGSTQYWSALRQVLSEAEGPKSDTAPLKPITQVYRPTASKERNESKELEEHYLNHVTRPGASFL